jgi:uncharacterized membrane protein YcfT
MQELQDEGRELVERMVRVHVRGANPDMTDDDKLLGLKQRFKWLALMFGLNILLVVIYAYTFYSGITQLGQAVFYLILGAFGMNVLLILYQRRQLGRAIAYLERI